MSITGQDTLKTRRTLSVGGKEDDYFSLDAAEAAGLGDVSRLPGSLKVLLENLLRHENGRAVTVEDAKALAGWLDKRTSNHEIAFHPARVLMQDFTGVPSVVDLAAMRQAMADMGGNPEKINPVSTCNLVIDHSVMIDFAGTPDAIEKNIEREFERNGERYTFLKWGQSAFTNFTVVPPGTGIVHQVNLEYLAKTVWTEEEDGRTIAMPDTVVGTDSHTTMVNGLSVLGWGVGGIEAEAAMLGQPVTMVIPEVVGFKVTGRLPEGALATDLVLRVVEMLRQKGVVGKFVEFFGPGLDELSLADQATLANMAPEYGATCGFFPIADDTLKYLKLTGRDEDQLAFLREERDYRNVILVELPNAAASPSDGSGGRDFALTTLRNAAVALWLELLYERLQGSGDTELAGIAAKSLKEVRYHRQHSSDWIVRLGDGTPESRVRMQAALNVLWPYFNELFAADGVDGVGPAWNELEPEWRARWATLMQEATLALLRDSAMQPRGIDGIHSEHMGHLLATMQYLQRTYPGGVW